MPLADSCVKVFPLCYLQPMQSGVGSHNPSGALGKLRRQESIKNFIYAYKEFRYIGPMLR